MWTFEVGTRITFHALEPVALRQLRQWQMWPLGLVKRSFDVMVMFMLPQRQDPAKPLALSSVRE